MLSWLVYAPCARFVALDLGYSSEEREFFEKVKKSLPADVRFEIDTFPFDQYPIHYMLKPGKVDSSGRPQGRTYAWKVSLFCSEQICPKELYLFVVEGEMAAIDP